MKVIESFTQRGKMKTLVFKMDDGGKVTQYADGNTFYEGVVKSRTGATGTRLLNRRKCPARVAQMQTAVDAWKRGER